MSIYIIASIIILLSALACYAFISQAIEKKRIQKQRLLMTLTTKHRNFMHMLNGFPPNFLTTELLSLIYRALINTCEQLSKIEPNNSRYQNEMALFDNQLSTLAQNNNVQSVQLDDPQQMKDIRQHLQELQHFVLQQQALKTINKKATNTYLDQIKRLAIQMTVDSYIFSAKQAQQNGKIRLAIHYFTLAKKQLAAENSTHNYDKQIIQMDTLLSKLEEKAAIATEVNSPSESPKKDDASKEWDTFNKKEKDDKEWKKKQVYD
jgi:hypothetical protein